MTEPVAQKILKENDRIALALREEFRRRSILCLNFISSPGSGKTLLLEKTLASFAPTERVAVLTGDIQTDNDARRLARARLPRQADHHRRRLPPRREDGRARPRRLEP